MRPAHVGTTTFAASPLRQTARAERGTVELTENEPEEDPLNAQLDPTHRTPVTSQPARLEMVWVTRAGRLEVQWSPAAPDRPVVDPADLRLAVARAA